jgi:hypothetical protein
MSNTQLDLSQFSQGSSPQKALLEQSRELVNKWAPTGLLDGLEDDHEVHGVSILLENQYNQLIQEATRTGTAEGSEEWSGVALPLVRRIFGEIVAKEFVSVQPMNLPSGLIFYLDFKYGTQQSQFNAGDFVHGDTSVEGEPEGGLYGEGRYGYSINDRTDDAATVQNLTLANNLPAGEYLMERLEADENLLDIDSGSTDLRLDKLALLTVDVQENADMEGVRTFVVEDEEVAQFFPRHTVVNQTGDPNARTGKPTEVEFVVELTDAAVTTSGGDVTGLDAAAPQSGDDVTVIWHEQPTAYDRGDFEDRSPNPNVGGSPGNPDSQGGTYEVLDIPEIDFDLEQQPIVAKTRKLKAVWTPELAQDLNAYHSIDAEAELTSMLSEYISMEIDLEILDMLIQNALTKEYWSAIPGYEYDQTTGNFVDRGSHTGTKSEWFETLGNKIQKVSNRIHQKTMRGGANFIVCSPDVATILESIEGYRVDTGGDEFNFAMGVQRVGTLYNRFQVYKNPYMLEDIMLVGFRGENFLETGAVYAPYVPLMMTPIVYDPNNFTPRRGVMTRYAKRIVRPEFYGLVVIGNQDQV